MKQYVLTYMEPTDNGALIHHREVFHSRIAAAVNYWLSLRDKHRMNPIIREQQVKI